MNAPHLASARARAIAGLVAAFCIFGAQFPVGKLGWQAGLDEHDLTALRFGTAGLLLLPLLARAGLGDLGGIGWWRGLCLGLLAGAPYGLLMLGGLQHAPAAHGAMLNPGVTILLLTLAGALLYGERPTRLRVAGIALLLGGLALIGWHSAVGLGGASWRGDLMFAAAGLCWGVFSLLTARWRLDPLLAAAVIAVLSLPYALAHLALDAAQLASVPVSALLLQALYHGALLSVAAMALYGYAIRTLGTSTAGLGNAIAPIAGTLSAIPLVGEWPAPAQWAGLAAICAGLMVAAGRQRAAPRR